jgi:nitrite reductase (NADH) small subunit
MSEVFVCKDGEIAEGGMKLVAAGDVEIGVFRHRGKYYAYTNECPHQGGPVCQGLRVPKVVQVINAERRYVRDDFDRSEIHFVCPWHGYEFNIETGAHAIDPRVRLRKYDLVERGDELYVSVAHHD